MKKVSSLSLLAALLLSGALPIIAHAQYGASAALTRAEFVHLIMDAKNIPVSGGSYCFADVGNQSVAPEICTARQRGIVTGDPSGRFRPNSPVLLIEAAAMVVRAEGVSVRYDSLWYRPYLELLGDWGAFPSSVDNIFSTITYNDAWEMITKAEGQQDTTTARKNLALQITASDETPEAGSQVTFRIRLENTGNRDLNNVTLSADLDSGMKYVSSTNGGYASHGRVIWDGIHVSAYGSTTLLLTVGIDDSVRSGDTLQLRADVEGKSAAKSIRVSGYTGNHVSLSIADTPDPVMAGGIITYKILVDNRDSSRVSVRPQAFLDSDMSVVSASDGGRWSGNTVVWDTVSLYGNEEYTLTLRVRVDSSVHTGDSVRLRVEAGNAADTETTRVEQQQSSGGNVHVTMTDRPDPVWRGDQLTYNFMLENTEDQDIVTTVHALLDNHTYFLSATPTAFLRDNEQVSWDSVRIASGQSRAFSVTVRVSSSVNQGDTLRLHFLVGNDEYIETTNVE